MRARAFFHSSRATARISSRVPSSALRFRKGPAPKRCQGANRLACIGQKFFPFRCDVPSYEILRRIVRMDSGSFYDVSTHVQIRKQTEELLFAYRILNASKSWPILGNLVICLSKAGVKFDAFVREPQNFQVLACQNNGDSTNKSRQTMRLD